MQIITKSHAGDEQISPEVSIRVYTPPSQRDRKLPLVVFAPGGGWLCGNLDTEDHLCRTLCGEVSCMVVSVDYRKFPEHKFPAPIDDCYAAYQWVSALGLIAIIEKSGR